MRLRTLFLVTVLCVASLSASAWEEMLDHKLSTGEIVRLPTNEFMVKLLEACDKPHNLNTLKDCRHAVIYLAHYNGGLRTLTNSQPSLDCKAQPAEQTRLEFTKSLAAYLAKELDKFQRDFANVVRR